MDAVILGAGPAGSTAARLLSQWGHDVVIVTRTPARPPLAESLPPSTAKLLDRIGVRDAVDGAGFLRSTGNTVRWGDDQERVEPFGSGALGHQVLRDRFDALLLEQAVAAGVRVREGVAGRVRLSAGGSTSATVRCTSPHGPASLVAPWILDCRGRSAARGDRGTPSHDGVGAPRTLALVGVWESERWPVSDPTHTLVESYHGGWAWSVPVNEQRRYLTAMVDPAVTRLDGRMFARQYHEQLALTKWLGPMAGACARMEGEPWACDATEYISPEIVTESVVRVGDAASFVDPLSSFGIKKALASAWLAAVVVHTALGEAGMAAHAMSLYQARELEMYDALRRASASLAGPARDRHESAFWRARMSDASDEVDPGSTADIPRPGGDARTRAALDDLRARDRVHIHPAAGVTRAPLPIVIGNRIALHDHLVSAAFPAGVRYVRNVDVVLLAELAAAHDEVGELYAAYARAAAPVPLPDFLGALATMIGAETLTLS